MSSRILQIRKNGFASFVRTLTTPIGFVAWWQNHLSMKEVNRVTTLLKSEMIGHHDGNVILDSMVRPKNSIGVQIVKFPNMTMETFGIVFKTEIVYTAKIKYVFEIQDAVFFENDRKRPDIDYLLNFCRDSFSKIATIFSQEIKKNGMHFDVGSRVAEFSKRDVLKLIQQELDEQYP